MLSEKRKTARGSGCGSVSSEDRIVNFNEVDLIVAEASIECLDSIVVRIAATLALQN